MTQHGDNTVLTDTVVRKHKYDGSVRARWEGTQLPSPLADWILVLHNPRVHDKSAAKDPRRAGNGDGPRFLHCLCTSEPLTILIEYDDSGQFAGAKCDAALPATVEGSVVEYVDLDLDLIVEWDFSSYVRDRDTFHIHREQMHYPDDVIHAAWQGIKLAQNLVDARAFPFDVERLSLLQP
jgi:hypothetical protein